MRKFSLLLLIFVLQCPDTLPQKFNLRHDSYIGISISVEDYGYGLEIGLLSELNPGIYASVRSNFRRPSSARLIEMINYNTAKNVFGHPEIGDITRSLEITAGVNYPVSASIFLMGGITWLQTEKFTEFFDKTYTYSYDGTYYADGVLITVLRPNISIGYLIEENFLVRVGSSFHKFSFLEAAVCYVF